VTVEGIIMANSDADHEKVTIELGNIVEVVVTAVDRALRRCGSHGTGSLPISYGGDIVIRCHAGSSQPVEIAKATNTNQ
jgi:hypothetical protein